MQVARHDSRCQKRQTLHTHTQTHTIESIVAVPRSPPLPSKILKTQPTKPMNHRSIHPTSPPVVCAKENQTPPIPSHPTAKLFLSFVVASLHRIVGRGGGGGGGGGPAEKTLSPLPSCNIPHPQRRNDKDTTSKASKAPKSFNSSSFYSIPFDSILLGCWVVVHRTMDKIGCKISHSQPASPPTKSSSPPPPETRIFK